MNFINLKFISLAILNELSLFLFSFLCSYKLELSLFRLVPSIVFLILAILVITKSTFDYLHFYKQQRKKTFVKNGIFSKVRFPFLLFIFLLNFSISLFFFDFLLFLIFLIFVPIWIVVARKVDLELYKKFGFQYYDYRRKVPMFLPIKISLHKEKIFEK